MNTSIISVYNSRIFSEKLTPSFAIIETGDILRITDKITIERFPDHHSGDVKEVEFFIFESQNTGQFVKLSMSQILKSRGSVADSLQKAIWNKDIKTGADLYRVLNERAIRISRVNFEDKPTPDGMMRRRVLTLDWVN